MAEPIQRLHQPKTEAKKPVAFSKIDISSISLGPSHGAGCSCNSCKGKPSDFSSIAATAITLPPITDHVHGPNCGCSEKQKLGEKSFSSVNTNVLILPQVHGAGCSCNSCKSQYQSKIDRFSSIDINQIALPSVHAAGCNCSECKGQNKKEQQTVKLTFDICAENLLAKNMANFQAANFVAQNPNTYTQCSLIFRKENSDSFSTSTSLGSALPLAPPQFIQGPAQPVHFPEVANSQNTETLEIKSVKNEPERKIKKQYIIGRYTYQDIVTIPWLRKKYGYLIGLVNSEEKSDNVSIATTKKAKMKNNKGIKPLETITKNRLTSSFVKPVNKAKVNLEQKIKELKERGFRKEKIPGAKPTYPQFQDNKRLMKEKIRTQHQQMDVINKIRSKKYFLVLPRLNSPKKKAKITPLVIEKMLKNTPTKIIKIIEKIKKGQKIRIKYFSRLTKDEVKKLMKLLKSKQIVKWLLLYSNNKKKNRLQPIKHLLGLLKNLLKK